MKVLHALEYSIPHLTGYTIRSKYLVENQAQQDIVPVVITSPLQVQEGISLQNFELINSVRYYRTGEFNELDPSKPLPLRLIKRQAYRKAYLKAIDWVAQEERAEIIHSHSSYLNGVYGNKVGKRLKIPTIYEVRGLWQETATIEVNTNPWHWKYLFVNYMDKKAMLEADRVVVISEGLKAEIADKGVNERNIVVVPNGVDTEHFKPREKNRDILDKFDLNDKIVFGFIGSIRKIEGLPLFLANLPEIVKQVKDVRVVMIGEGDEVPELKRIVEHNGLDNHVVFIGRVPHDQILDYYSILDVLVYPRIDAKVNHKVTPLKPLEAMAMEKIVLASDVGGLHELIEDEKNGLLFKVDNGEHLVSRCMNIIDNFSWAKSIGKDARDWVIRVRDWKNVVKIYNSVYEELIQG